MADAGKPPYPGKQVTRRGSITITKNVVDYAAPYRVWQREHGIVVTQYTIFKGQGGGKKYVGRADTLEQAEELIEREFVPGNYYVSEYRGGDELEIEKVRKEKI